jgi:hypothetical protein
MQRVIYFLFFLFFCVVPFSFCEEVKYNASYVIPDGSFLRIEEYDISSSYGVKLYFHGVLSGHEGDWSLMFLRVSKVDSKVTIIPVYYASGAKVNVSKYVLRDVEYSLYPDDSGETGIIVDNNVTTEKVVYLNRIELYVLWLLSVQAISCGVLLFLCFKGFEKL